MTDEARSTYVGFEMWDDTPVPLDQLAAELTRLPLDGVLGAISVLSLNAARLGHEFWSPRVQGDLLAEALVDDFPRTIRGAWKLKDPKLLPRLSTKQGLVHEHGLAALTHLTLLHADPKAFTPTIDQRLQRRVLRLLLILNDHLYLPQPEGELTLEYRRRFAADHLRSAQFNVFFAARDVEAMMQLGRQWLIYREYLPQRYADADAQLSTAAGVTVEDYFLIVALMISAVHHSMKGTWFALDPLLSSLHAGKEIIAPILRSWTTTPTAYRAAWSERLNSDVVERPLFDLVPLRTTPIVEARAGELLCPAPSLMFAKMLDGPFFLLSDYFREDQRTRRHFQSSLGMAYQDYAHELVERIARKDRRGPWTVWAEPGPHHDQFSDSYLQREGIGIAMEHKGGRVETDFLIGGDGRRVVGPDADCLRRLEAGEHIPLREGKKADTGLLTGPMWQQSAAAHGLVEWAEQTTGSRPTRVFPVITHWAHLFVDDWIREGYLDVLAGKAGLYAAPGWKPPQWLSVADLECLAAIADANSLDLLRVLEAKDKVPSKRFDVFMYQRYRYVTDRRVYEKAMAVLELGKARFWPKQP